ncbi:hypothetical protein CGGC5_v010963 [Colletotrichum fructicola Nara gc5]|uniref:Uncharacterized protein n=2 Tax=Colletotrichum fructicola (strain Nara gc5) TaxID=1213859 RepID=A0A7J6IWH1_COLFN|nr:hypothetical protein CGGC5_v010963 [Colletotrichum fructicola Nara gc5]
MTPLVPTDIILGREVPPNGLSSRLPLPPSLFLNQSPLSPPSNPSLADTNTLPKPHSSPCLSVNFVLDPPIMPERPSEFRQRGETTDDWLDRLRRVNSDAGDDVDGFSKMMAEIERETEEAAGFRWHSHETQQRQDAILAHFQDFVKKLERLSDDVTGDQLEEACFPPPKAGDSGRSKWKSLSRNLKYFMGFVVRFGVPPGIHDAAVSDSCLAQYRDVLMFWVSRSYRLRDMDGPRSHEVSNEVTEVVQHLDAKHGITRRSQSIAEKSYVDIVELRQMFDEGMKAVDGKNTIGR